VNGGGSVKESRVVLVVEDDAEVMSFLDELLSGNGYAVLKARNGVDAMVALTAPEAELPGVVLLDINLPLESGISVLSFLRKVMLSGLPVVVLTGSAGHEEEEAVRELGVSSYLRKPATSGDVLSALERALD
jgi:chemosensory pili system protein ChpA (sensor histidine kinase/response regulator)